MFAALLAVVAYERRHEIRRYLNGGKARDLGLGKVLAVAIVLFAALTVALFASSEGILVDWFDAGIEVRELANLERKRIDDEANAARLYSALDEKRGLADEKKAELEQLMAGILPAGASGALFDEWWSYLAAETREAKLASALSQALGGLATDQRAVDPQNEESASARLSSNARAATEWRNKAIRFAGWIGVSLFALVVIALALYLRVVARHRKKLAATCPLCLAVGHLKVEPAPGCGKVLRCSNVIREQPFLECAFDFPEVFQRVTKLSFPTLGVPTSGKTHWLAMLYRQLNQGTNIPQGVEFAKIRSKGAGHFDQICENVLSRREAPEGTNPALLPSPLIFNFIDRDKMGRSNVLVNVFDYAGEVLARKTLDDYMRRRAFSADGYFFFLDPTKSSDEQIAPLTNFRQDVRHVKKLKAGQQLHCPVALCVPKIDLLPEQPYADTAGGDPVDLFFQEIAEIGWEMDSKSIRARSDLMRNLRDVIWPGWEIEKTIDEVFGGRYMFFPFTPVGLDGMGEEWTAGKRPISPVGIDHPLMWLLHMNGYRVL